MFWSWFSLGLWARAWSLRWLSLARMQGSRSGCSSLSPRHSWLPLWGTWRTRCGGFARRRILHVTQSEPRGTRNRRRGPHRESPDNTFERTAGSHALAATAQRAHSAALGDAVGQGPPFNAQHLQSIAKTLADTESALN